MASIPSRVSSSRHFFVVGLSFELIEHELDFVTNFCTHSLIPQISEPFEVLNDFGAPE